MQDGRLYFTWGVGQSLDRGQQARQEGLAIVQELDGGRAALRPWEGETEAGPC